jgi:hypothetical protein
MLRTTELSNFVEFDSSVIKLKFGYAKEEDNSRGLFNCSINLVTKAS